MLEAQIILNKTGQQDEKSSWASSRPLAGFMLGKSQMKTIPLTQGKVAVVDDEDFELLNQYKWRTDKGSKTFYGIRTFWDRKKKRYYSVMLHREIMRTPKGIEVDHINGNGLDDRKQNMRNCTRAEQSWNRPPNTNSASKYKGVCWDKNRKKWTARIGLNRTLMFIGRYDFETSAARAYDKKARELFGEFAWLNFK